MSNSLINSLRASFLPPFCLLGTLFLGACDWVDSTGNQGAEQPVTEVFIDDALVSGPIAIGEQGLTRIVPSRITEIAVDQTFTWSDAPIEQGKLDVCANVNGFDMAIAADSLLDACTDPTQCEFEFLQQNTEDGATEFSLQAPVLKASVGLKYGLTVEDEDGRSSTEELDFCLTAFNEEPVANDDTYVVIEGTRLVVGAGDNSLLSNDSDDIDVSNTEFRIQPVPSIEPMHAAFFELNPDGSFSYESSLTGIRADQLDSFEYELSDGVYISKAQVTLRVVTSNQAPELIDDIPVLMATEGDAFIENLALYFVDPEDNDLTFSFAEDDELPSDGSLLLSEDGLFSGIPGEDDVGSYSLTLIASDGGRETEAVVTLEIDAAPVVPLNNPPEYEEDSVFDQIILLGRTIRPIEPVFIDPDGDELTYSVIGTSSLPTGVEIDEETGVISGEPTRRTWVRNLRVEATDPFGDSDISEPFFIRVR
ncbi:MAG: Ig-like domain-containing protein [Granulosicoccus sp.]